MAKRTAARTLTPKEPGAAPAATPAPESAQPQASESAAAAPEVDAEAADLIGRLPELDNEQLIALDHAEREGESREPVLEAIDAELKRRIAAAAPPPATQDPEPTAKRGKAQVPTLPAAGVAVASQRPRAADIDPQSISQPVLTDEGYVCPVEIKAPANVDLRRLDVLDHSQLET